MSFPKVFRATLPALSTLHLCDSVKSLQKNFQGAHIKVYLLAKLKEQVFLQEEGRGGLPLGQFYGQFEAEGGGGIH